MKQLTKKQAIKNLKEVIKYKLELTPVVSVNSIICGCGEEYNTVEDELVELSIEAGKEMNLIPMSVQRNSEEFKFLIDKNNTNIRLFD
jgi:hypothetical protein